MIDKLVLQCEFLKVGYPARYPGFYLAELGVPLEQSINRDGQVFKTRHPWESIPSSYESMAFKIFDNRYDGLDKFYIEIQASPAKLMQGHNKAAVSAVCPISAHTAVRAGHTSVSFALGSEIPKTER